VHCKLKKLDSLLLNKVIVEDNIECAFPNVDISWSIFLTLILSNEANKKSKQNNDLLLLLLLLLYSSALHQHIDDNVSGTDVAMPRVRGV
jgi:hypothetical protein